MKLNLTRPIIFFDLETTGTNVTRDRIVELSYLKVFPDGTVEEKCRRINPGMHIPEESTAVHHITDEDVKDAPRFKQVAQSLFTIFADCDIAGFNSNKFDVPLLVEEFYRAGLNLDLSDRRLIDVQNIFHKMEPRTLIAAYKKYCGKNLNDAHSAAADTRATYEVLLGQLDTYGDLKNDVDYLSDFSKFNRDLDLAGRIVLDDEDRPVFNFGKHRGTPVFEVFRKDPSFYSWILNGDFPRDTKNVLTRLKYKYDHRND